ncbi:DUF4255 domain-containing protein [Pseudomonas kielensis]|uniref:Pvc16 family protein n=1 Tax=Pseudomonas kielensis TaxID=2762577 RepID=UPI0022401062|nr:Pvc16 family protein [Pseudomonas kielensis]UZM16220.1 DUF4255 domain-containing protein [Pseudomonas kielensis]
MNPTEPTEPAIESDLTLLTLSDTLQKAVKAYLPGGVNICFDLPDPDAPPTCPTVSLFLYSIQDDLTLRTGIVRQFDPNTGAMVPGSVNIKCDYLITYWEPKPDIPGEGPTGSFDSPAMCRMNEVLNALINNRELQGMPGSYTRVITPQELGNLSHFWQALGNTPRLCLNYSATVPVKLTDPDERYDLVAEDKLQVVLEHKPKPEENLPVRRLGEGA